MILNAIVKSIKRDSHRGTQSVTSDLATTDIIACINRAVRDVQKLLPKKFFKKSSTVALTSGVAGTASTWSLASDVQEPGIFHYTKNSSTTVLTKIDSDKEWFEKVWNPVTPVADPKFYREIAPNSSTFYKQIEVFPIPGSSITLNYEYCRTKDSDYTVSDINSEVTYIPDYVQDLLEKGGLYYFLKGFDDPMQKIAKLDYEESKLAFEMADERDLDSDVRLRLTSPGYQLPGFRL